MTALPTVFATAQRSSRVPKAGRHFPDTVSSTAPLAIRHVLSSSLVLVDTVSASLCDRRALKLNIAVAFSAVPIVMPDSTINVGAEFSPDLPNIETCARDSLGVEHPTFGGNTIFATYEYLNGECYAWTDQAQWTASISPNALLFRQSFAIFSGTNCEGYVGAGRDCIPVWLGTVVSSRRSGIVRAECFGECFVLNSGDSSCSSAVNFALLCHSGPRVYAHLPQRD